MGLLFNDNEAIKKEVEEKFGARAKYLFAMKHNGPVKSTLKLFYSMDFMRTKQIEPLSSSSTKRAFMKRKFRTQTKRNFTFTRRAK